VASDLNYLCALGPAAEGLLSKDLTLITHWVRDAISLAHEVRKLPTPLGIIIHSTRSVVSSQALFRGVPLEDISTRKLLSSFTTWIWVLVPVFFPAWTSRFGPS